MVHILSACSQKQADDTLIYIGDTYRLYADSITGNNGRKAHAPSALSIVVDADTVWHADSIARNCPEFRSGQTIVDALFNRASVAHGEDTPPTPYSILLAGGAMNSQASMDALKGMVSNGVVTPMVPTSLLGLLDETGAVWTSAAWEIYAVTGDDDWLRYAYSIAERTLHERSLLLADLHTGLHRGIPSYMYSRAYFPAWSSPDALCGIYSMGVNTAIYQAYISLSRMASALGEDKSTIEEYISKAKRLRHNINDRMWIPNLHRYSQYLYGGAYPLMSASSDNRAQAIAILTGITLPGMGQPMINDTPVSGRGIMPVTPSPPDSPDGNDALTQAFWLWASAKEGNTASITAGLGSLINNSLLSVTSGNWDYTPFSSFVLRVLAGMTFTPQGIVFSPTVPMQLDGKKYLHHFRYRNAILDITISGTGNHIASFAIDGVPEWNATFPSNLNGLHEIEITLSDNITDSGHINMTSDAFMPPTPTAVWNGLQATISGCAADTDFEVWVNGALYEEITQNHYTLVTPQCYTVTQMVPVTDQRWCGFATEPMEYIPAGSLTHFPAGSLLKNAPDTVSAIELSDRLNPKLEFEIDISRKGSYIIDLEHVSRHSGANLMAARQLEVNGHRAGTFLLPCRHSDDGTTAYGTSAPIIVTLDKGTNHLSLTYHRLRGSDGINATNRAILRAIRIILLQ